MTFKITDDAEVNNKKPIHLGNNPDSERAGTIINSGNLLNVAAKILNQRKRARF